MAISDALGKHGGDVFQPKVVRQARSAEASQGVRPRLVRRRSRYCRCARPALECVAAGRCMFWCTDCETFKPWQHPPDPPLVVALRRLAAIARGELRIEVR